MKSVIAIIGRANVGKSTLFNRLVGSQVAIVEDLPGTTRDRVFANASLQDNEVTLVDTGGLDPVPSSTMSQKIKKQVNAAIAEADALIFLVDIRDGLVATDYEIAEMLRKSNKPVVLVANKADNFKHDKLGDEFYQLGLGAPVAISAHHARNISELVDKLNAILPASTISTDEDKNVPKLAIVGRPNAGKSMLLNAMVGEERAIVDQAPGTTRDAIDTVFTYKGQNLILIDTAGIRRRGRSSSGIEYYGLIRSLRAINRCDIALLVIDATELLTTQDIHIAGYIKEACKGVIFIVNKWDLITEQHPEEFTSYIKYNLKFMAHAPILFTSAKLEEGINKIIPAALTIWQERQKQVPDIVIDKLIKEAVSRHAPPRKGLRRLEIFRAYQDGINPPSFFFVVNDPQLVHFSYQRYLENKLRQIFGFSGTSLRFIFKRAARKKPDKVGSRKQ